ncbi:pentapeptide repeat-containing protein [Bdellovibrio sp. NC01]|uniref:pentapeptide repeat-containing protein n=1 Tax=Bdellovibrio sp. NC01 TaxID=2220073 RepID=UPI001159B05B|nr:pentapeptide repeat-containing protein [Bdellovibrio sp. NC01]QDK36502.1 hypothetical protein DOE51_02265 [Bdellovibrio sp. NC01]
MGRAVMIFLILFCVFSGFAQADVSPLQGSNRRIQASLLQGRTYENFLCQNCRLQGASLKNTVLKLGTCRYCDFSEIDGVNLDARSINFDHSKFRLANLENADLSAVRAYFSNFQSANLKNAKMWGSDLRYCNFENSDLRNADLSNALLVGASFQGAKFNHATKLPFSKEQALSKGMLWEK